MDAISAPSHAPEPDSPVPLLPAVLLGPATFLWLWALPVGVLLLLNVQAFWLIEGNLSASQRHDALLLGAGNAANLLIGVAIYLIAKYRDGTAAARSATQPWWGAPALVVQTGYLWWTAGWTDRILPASVTVWIYPPDRHLFNQFAFAMLPLFLGILRLAGTRAPKNPGTAIAINVSAAIGGPILLYVTGLVISTFPGFEEAKSVVFASGMVVFGALMFFGIVRVLLLVMRSLQRWRTTGQPTAVILFGAVLPLCGLLLNRLIPFPVDLQAWEIYALVIVNAGLLWFAVQRHFRWPRLGFHLLCGTFPFSLYFFIVFLPYTPLSILAVLALGTGFLVLAPIFLFVLHLYALHQSHCDLPEGKRGWRTVLTGLSCFLLLPAFFTVRGLADKTALNTALNYVYTPAITTENLRFSGSLTNLRRALSSHRSYKNGIYYPLLSDFYAWLVFDNLVLPDDKLDRLETTFFGSAGSRENQDVLRKGLNVWGNERSVRERTRMPRARPTPRTVDISKLETKTSPSGTSESVTTFTFTLKNTSDAPAEFAQKLPLPSGVFVTGFRLHIDGRPVPGRIFEKKTALWVYTMIRDSERRDPGLIYYNTRDELELRIFPVNANVPVLVEIDFLHPSTTVSENVSASPDDPAARLNALGRTFGPRIAQVHAETTVSGINAAEFPAVEREPYLHLIVDRSRDNACVLPDLATAIAALRKKFPSARLGRVTLANHDIVDLVPTLVPLDELAKTITGESLRNLPASGGLALDLCLAHAIRQHREHDLDRLVSGDRPPPAPVFVILSTRASSRPLDLPLTETWRYLLSGLEVCELGSDDSFQTHLHAATGDSSPLFRLGGSVRPLSTRQVMRFPTTSSSALAYWSPQETAWKPVQGTVSLGNDTTWSQAVALQLQDQDEGRSPGDYRVERKTLVDASRQTGVLIPAASYIVVENSAQWRMLELSERQKLGQNAALDFRETPAPSAVWLGAGLALWLGIRRWYGRRELSADRNATSITSMAA